MSNEPDRKVQSERPEYLRFLLGKRHEERERKPPSPKPDPVGYFADAKPGWRLAALFICKLPLILSSAAGVLYSGVYLVQRLHL